MNKPFRNSEGETVPGLFFRPDGKVELIWPVKRKRKPRRKTRRATLEDIQKTTHSDVFKAAYAESIKANELNDCGVRAASIACRVGYSEAHRALKEAGRKDRRGTTTTVLKTAVRALGFEMVEQAIPDRTPMTRIKNYTRQGDYIAYVRGHVAPITDGVIHDQTDGKRNQVRHLWKIERKQ